MRIYLHYIMKLTIAESVTIRVLLKDSIQDYKERAKLFSTDLDDDLDYLMYFTMRIKELKEIYNKIENEI